MDGAKGEKSIGRSKRRLAIMIYLATGWTPWGVQLIHKPADTPYLSLCGNEYIMCCGHVMGRKEARQFVDAGLLQAGPPDHFGRETLVISDAGRKWLSDNW